MRFLVFFLGNPRYYFILFFFYFQPNCKSVVLIFYEWHHITTRTHKISLILLTKCVYYAIIHSKSRRNPEKGKAVQDPQKNTTMVYYPILECKDLTKRFGNVNAVSNFSLRFPEGKIIGILGPNGSGKTTLIKMIAGLLLPSSGSITVDGYPISAKTKSLVSYLPDTSFFANWMTVNDCFKLFSEFYSDFDMQRAEEMLGMLGIDKSLSYKSLSKGTKEKVQLISCLSRHARIYLLDEPIAGVDPAARDYILNTILGSFTKDSTVLISTHLLADVEQVLDEFVFIKNGVAIAYNSVQNSREETGKSLNELFKEVFRCY